MRDDSLLGIAVVIAAISLLVFALSPLIIDYKIVSECKDTLSKQSDRIQCYKTINPQDPRKEIQ